jgi:hypothetical protein
MGFLSGSATFERFRIKTDPTGTFGEEHLKTLKKFRVGATKTNLYETPNVGFSGGAHLLDTEFDEAKNIIGDAMHFGIRVDSCSIPGPIKRAWTQMELAGIVKDNTGGKPTKAQREEAKEAVETRCAAEAEKGNFRRMSETSVLWDANTETIFLGSTSEKVNDGCLELLNKAFGLEFLKVTSGSLAVELTEGSSEQTSVLFASSSTSFHPEGHSTFHWWNGMQDNYDYLGNEFLMWLWWYFETKSDTIKLSDDTEVSGMFARSLSLDCPLGENGKESISSDSPVALPEALLAIRMGKLPRKAGLTLVRDGEQYDFTLKAETFSINAARISQVGDDSPIRDKLDRIESIRQVAETVDLLFGVFCERRLGANGKTWTSEAKKINGWLRTDRQIAKKKAA